MLEYDGRGSRFPRSIVRGHPIRTGSAPLAQGLLLD